MAKAQILHVKAEGAALGDFSYAAPGSLKGALRLAAAASAPVTVYLHPGIYRLNRTLKLGPEISQVSFRALGNGVVFDGGVEIVGWHKEHRGERVLLAADVSEYLSTKAELKSLYVNGQRKQACRYPADTPLKAKITESRAHCRLPARLCELEDHERLELVLNYDWICRRLKIRSIDIEGVDFVPDQIRLSPEANLQIENLPVEFLQPGQWTVDPVSRTLFYMPEAGETLEDVEFATGGLTTIMALTGDHESSDYVENVVFDGINFLHSGDTRLVNSRQAECDCSAAVTLTGAVNCRFENCSFKHTSGWGLALKSGCRDNVVSHCEFADLGAGGIKADGSAQPDNSGVTANNAFVNNRIHEGGRFWNSAVGILTCHSGGNLISGNEISFFHYSGISCGWVWGYGENISRDNLIVNNHIHHLGNDCLLVDMGGIYTLGVQPGSVIRGNVIHDIGGEQIAWGIYLDEGSTDFIVEMNLVYNTRSECFHLHYGRENLVRHNVFVFSGREGVCSVTRGTMNRIGEFTPGEVALRFSNNLMLSSGAPFIIKYLLDYKDKEDLSCIESDYNILQCTRAEMPPVIIGDGFHMFELTFQTKLSEKELHETARLEKNSLLSSNAGPLSKEILDRFVSAETASLYQQIWQEKKSNKA